MQMSNGWEQGLRDLWKLLIAYVLTLPVGWYREREAGSVGVRTFPLEPRASCGYVLLGLPMYSNSIEAQSRIIQRVGGGNWVHRGPAPS